MNQVFNIILLLICFIHLDNTTLDGKTYIANDGMTCKYGVGTLKYYKLLKFTQDSVEYSTMIKAFCQDKSKEKGYEDLAKSYPKEIFKYKILAAESISDLDTLILYGSDLSFYITQDGNIIQNSDSIKQINTIVFKKQNH